MPIAITRTQRAALYELIEHGRRVTNTTVRRNLIAKGLLVDPGTFAPQTVTDAAYEAMGWAVPDAPQEALIEPSDGQEEASLTEMSDKDLNAALHDLCVTFDATFDSESRESMRKQITAMLTEQDKRIKHAIERVDHTPYITNGINHPNTARGACTCGWLAPFTRVTVKATKNDIGFHLADVLDIEDRR